MKLGLSSEILSEESLTAQKWICRLWLHFLVDKLVVELYFEGMLLQNLEEVLQYVGLLFEIKAALQKGPELVSLFALGFADKIGLIALALEPLLVAG